MRAGAILVASACLTGCGGHELGRQTDDVIHGQDDRLDYFEVSDPWLRELTARSVVAVVKAERIDDSDPSAVKLLSPSLGEKENLCEGERFFDHPTAASCTATLVAGDLVLTAGHCVRPETCAELRFVFGYYFDAPGELHPITREDVFSCSEVVARFDGLSEAGDLDYAVVRLDRPAIPRFAPAPMRTKPVPLVEGEPLAVVSFGSGLPAKIDVGARVVDGRPDTVDYFYSDSDTFAHSSGAGVFHRDSGELAGIVARGPRDYVVTDEGCARANVCETSCEGYYAFGEATYTHHAAEDACSVLPADTSLCL